MLWLSTVQWKHPIGIGTGFYCICTIPVDLVINCLLNMNIIIYYIY
jgi:hypothetical protein